MSPFVYPGLPPFIAGAAGVSSVEQDPARLAKKLIANAMSPVDTILSQAAIALAGRFPDHDSIRQTVSMVDAYIVAVEVGLEGLKLARKAVLDAVDSDESPIDDASGPAETEGVESPESSEPDEPAVVRRGPGRPRKNPNPTPAD